MKNVKKLLSILMVLTLVLALGATAFADEGATAGVKIADELKDHTFTAYQIFKGTQNGASGNALAAVEWGDGINAEAFVAALKAIDGEKFGACDAKDPNTVVKALNANKDDGELAKKVADAAANCLKGEGKSFTGETTLDKGYYLIKDTTKDLNGNAAYNDVVLQVTEYVEVKYKTDVPESDKFVKDANDTEGTTTDWQKTADHDIGDQVSFQLKGTLPDNYGDYTTYYLAFHDKAEAGLTFNASSVKVYVNGELIETGYEVKVPEGEAAALTDGCTFEVVFENVKVIEAAAAGSIITVEYTAELNENCVIGNPGNHNTSNMEFSNDSHSTSHGKTPDKTVVVFTYDMDVNKKDGNKQDLDGAGFTLLKKVKTGGKEVILNEDTPYEQTYEDVIVVGEINPAEGAPTGHKFTFEGLDDGNYILVESTVPDGYNKAADVEFTVTAEHAESTNVTSPSSDPFTVEMKPAENEAIIDTDVINNSGLELPETGGIGTTIFYVAGAILVAGAVILMVTRKRMSGAEK